MGLYVDFRIVKVFYANSNNTMLYNGTIFAYYKSRISKDFSNETLAPDKQTKSHLSSTFEQPKLKKHNTMTNPTSKPDIVDCLGE